MPHLQACAGRRQGSSSWPAFLESPKARAQTGGICARTQQVRDGILALISGVTDCAAVTEAQLASVTGHLDLANSNIGTLQAGDFDGLTSLTYLELHRNELSSLQAGVFSGLTSLTYLDLQRNELSSLPAGVFSGLTSLEELLLGGNSVNPLPLAVSLEKVADGRFRAKAPAGAPFGIVLPVSVTGPGAIAGGATTITIPAGGLASDTLTVTRTAGTTFAVTVDIGTLPNLPSNHGGYALVKSGDLPLEVLAHLPLVLNVDAIAGNDTVNIVEKAAGFTIGGDTGSEGGVAVAVTVGTEELTATSDNSGAWSVSVPADASYITGTSVTVTVSASKTGFTSPSDVTRTLTVDLAAPTAPAYTAPASLKVGVAVTVTPSGGAGIAGYGATGLPSGLSIDPGTGVIGGTPDTHTGSTQAVTVTVTDAAGNSATTAVTFPAVDKGDQTLAGFSYSAMSVTFGSAAPTVTAPTGAVTAVTYSATPAAVCTVNASTGALTLAGVGECVITATAASDADYNEATAEFTVTVQPLTVDGPDVSSVEITSDPDKATYGYKIGDAVEATVTFSAAVDITGTPQLELDFAGTPKPANCTAATNTSTMVCAYTVAVNDSAPNGVAIAANTLTLNGGTITATGSTTLTADLDHGAVAIAANHKVDGIRPTLVTTGSEAPTTSTDGTQVILTFSETIGTVMRTDITIRLTVGSTTVTAPTTAANADGTKVVLDLNSTITSSIPTLTVALAADAVEDTATNGNLAVAATAVINAVDTPEDPLGTLKARRGDGEVHLEWVPVAAVPTDPDRAYQLRYGAEGGESNQWRDIPGSAPGGPHARSYTVTGLENGTRYAFELRVRRDSGFGTAAKIRQTPEAPRWSVSTNRRSVHEGEDVTLSIATRNAVGFYSAPEALTLAVMGQIVLEFATIKGADPEDFEIRVDGHKVQGYTKDITFLNFDKDLDRDPFPAQHFDVEVPVGSTSLDVTVTVLADEEEDGQEHMSFMVFRGEELVNEDTWDGTGVNIESRDAGVVKQLAVADAEATEGEDPSLDFVVTLAPTAAWTVTVDYATHAGTARAGADYTHTSGALTFAPGETAKTVSVPVIDDTVEDTPETLTVKLSNANPPYNEEEGEWEWGSQEAGVLIADSVATGTIRNTEDQAEPRAVSVSDASAAEGDSVVFTVSLSATSSQQVTVDYATSDGTATAGEDYTATSGTLTFQAGETTKTISVPITDDTEDDGGETFTLTLSNASGADLGDAEATGTIRDTKTAVDLSADFPESAFTSKRHTGSDDRPQVVVAFSEAVAEFAANTPSVSVTGASGLSVQTHTEDGLENAYVFFMTPDGDGDVTFALTTNAACAAGGICTADGTVLTQVPAAWTIPGPSGDSSSLSVADAEATEEEDSTMAFVVTLDPAASDTVTVDYATSDGSAEAGNDYTATSGTLSFSAGETRKTISVAISDDTDNEGDETFTVTLSNAAGADLGTKTATGTIRNRTVAPLTARFEGVPEAHDGQSAFSFRAAFSEDIGISYQTLRDESFTTTGATTCGRSRWSHRARKM